MIRQVFHTTKDYLDGFLNLIYPEHCDICYRELTSQDKNICFICKADLHYTYFEKYKESTKAQEVFWGRLNLEDVYSLLYYEKGNSTQRILHHIKYRNGRNLGIFMGEIVGKKLLEIKSFQTVDAIVPIPLHSKKEFQRGYNQSLLIAQGVQKSFQVPIIDALYRTKNDESQTRKSKEERYENVKGKFALKEDKLKNNRHVLVVDDVLTTGATLEFASRAIMEEQKNIKVSIATIAIADN